MSDLTLSDKSSTPAILIALLVLAAVAAGYYFYFRPAEVGSEDEERLKKAMAEWSPDATVQVLEYVRVGSPEAEEFGTRYSVPWKTGEVFYNAPGAASTGYWFQDSTDFLVLLGTSTGRAIVRIDKHNYVTPVTDT